VDEDAVFRALANGNRLQILNWLRNPRKHFSPQTDGDLIKRRCRGIKQWTFYEGREAEISAWKRGLTAEL